jgi:hypothetical protein
MKIVKYLFDDKFINEIGLEINNKYSVQYIIRYLAKHRLIFLRKNGVKLSTCFKVQFYLEKYTYSKKDFLSFVKSHTINNIMEKHNLCTLLKKDDFDFLKVIEL